MCHARPFPEQLAGASNPAEMGKPYPANTFHCKRYNINYEDTDGEDYIEEMKGLHVMTVAKTALFFTVEDAANYLVRQGDAKDQYYGQLLQKADPLVFNA